MKTLKNSIIDNAIPKARYKLGQKVALGSDFLQFIFFPIFCGGLLSPCTDLLNLATGISLSCILGFNPAYIPCFCIKEIPVLDTILPSWSAAFYFATKNRPII